MLKTILVGIGIEPYASVATRYALELARQHGASLTGMGVLDLDRLSQVGMVPLGAGAAAVAMREDQLARAQEEIAHQTVQFERACREARVPYRVLTQGGDPFELMAAATRYHDLIVCGLKGLFEHGVVLEPEDELMKLIAAGVRPMIAVGEEHRDIRRVLIAYSGSMESAKTMKRFVQMRLWPNAKLRVVTFDHPIADAQKLLADAASYCAAHGLHVDTDFVEGSPQHQLLPYAARNEFDMLVVGNSAKSVLRKKLLGETALELMRSSDRPLFLAQ